MNSSGYLNIPRSHGQECIPEKIVYKSGTCQRDVYNRSSLLDWEPSSSTQSLSSSPSNTGRFLSNPNSPKHRNPHAAEDGGKGKSIHRSVSKLGSLADECSRLSANLSSVVSRSSQILDNSFLSSQPHLTDHVTSLNHKACMDIVTAIGTYKEYVDTMEEMMMAQEKEEEDMVNKWEGLDVAAREMFRIVKLREVRT